MIFKSAIIKAESLELNQGIDLSQLTKFVHEYMNVRGFVIFKTKRYKSTSPFGVEINDQEIPLSEVVGEGKIIDIKFFIFHLNSKTVYYDGNLSEVHRLLKVFFSIEKPTIHPEIGYDDLYTLNSLKIVDLGEHNLSLFSEGFSIPEAEILELADDCKVKEQTREIKFLTFTGIRPQRLKTLVEKNNSGSKRIFLTGADIDGNTLVSDGEGQLSRKINVFSKNFTWEEKKELVLSDVLDELLKNLRTQ